MTTEIKVITDKDCLNWGLQTKEFLLKNKEVLIIDQYLSLLEELEINIQIVNQPAVGYSVLIGDGAGNYNYEGDELTVKQVCDLLFNLTLKYVEQGISHNFQKVYGVNNVN